MGSGWEIGRDQRVQCGSLHSAECDGEEYGLETSSGLSRRVRVLFASLLEKSKLTHTPVLVDRYILDGGVHFVAGLRYILPHPITSIFATSSQLQTFLPPCDTLTGVLTATPPPSSSSSSPISGTFTFSFGTESGTARHYTILGSKASLKVDFSGGSKHTLTLSTLTTNPEESEPHNTVIEFGQHGVEEEFDAFAQALLDGSGSESWKEVMRRSGPRATLRDLGVIEGGLKSSKEGKAIDLRELVGGEEWFKIE